MIAIWVPIWLLGGVALQDSVHLSLALALVIGVILVIALFRLWRTALSDLRTARSTNQSLSTRYGKLSEQFMPFVSSYPWDPQQFRFIGSPIDGIQFEDDRIILVEFKTATSKFSSRQRSIRDQVRDGRVEFEEFRLG